MDNETRLIREKLIELIEQERLTGDALAFDGEPLEALAAQGEYRPDGYSHETHKGCRRHRLVDERLAEMELSDDSAEQEVAADFPRWFFFDPRHYPGLLPQDDPDEGEALAREAFSNAMIRTYWLLAGSNNETILPADFVTGPRNDRVFHTECRCVFSNKKNLDEAWPAAALDMMDEAVERIKNPPPGWN